MNEESTNPSPARTWSFNMIVAGALAAVLVVGLGYYFFNKSSTKNPQQAAQAEVKSLVAEVSKLMVLPTDEQPIVATVADPAKLQDQPFFAKAKKGDKVLIYNTARKAILYDPVANLIIDVAPLSVPSSTPTPAR